MPLSLADPWGGGAPPPKSRRPQVLKAPESTVIMHELVSFFLCHSKSFHIPTESTIYRPCFFSLQFQNSLNSNTVRMHHLPSLFFKIFSAVPNRFINTVRMHELLSYFLSVIPNRFKYRQKAPFIVLVFYIFSSVPNSLNSNTVRMHHLPSLF